MVAKDEASYGSNDETKKYLNSIGSRRDEFGFRDSYAVIFYRYKTLYGETNPNGPVQLMISKQLNIRFQEGEIFIPNNLELFSKGFYVGNNAYIKVDEEIISTNERGLNIVVLDENIN